LYSDSVIDFEEEREEIAARLGEARQQEADLTTQVDRLTAELIRVRARIASLEAEDRVYAGQLREPGSGSRAGDLSHMTIREAILTVLNEAKPEPMRLRDLEQALADRGKRVAGGLSVDLTSLKGAKKVLNPAWGYWTVPQGPGKVVHAV
jgi:predicted nuclease with TOPRIM domain